METTLAHHFSALLFVCLLKGLHSTVNCVLFIPQLHMKYQAV